MSIEQNDALAEGAIQAALSKEHRDALPDDMFAVPETRELPIHDERHVRMAWSQIGRTKDLSGRQRAEGRRRIMRRAKELGLDTSGWQVHAVAYQLSAMSLEMPEVKDHPNRMPFSGILTRIDQASDKPPLGTDSKCVVIPKDVAEAGLASLLGMAIDFKPDLTGHDNQAKIGIITEATISGNAVHIAGFLYASDFPEECARIKAEKNQLGFSYECQAAIADPKADPWVVTHVIFTGAAVLKKHLAAYTTTSLAAQAQEELAMNPDELKKLIAEAVAPLATSVQTLSQQVADVKANAEKTQKSIEAAGALHAKVKPHAEKLRACAAEMEAAGIGTHPQRGHVSVLNHMADRMEAEAMMGHIPTIHRDHDYINASGATNSTEQHQSQATQAAAQDPATKASLEKIAASVAELGTKVNDLSAKSFQAAATPERRTISAEIKTLLDKHGLSAAAEQQGGQLTTEQIDKALEGLSTQQRIAQKLRLNAAGLIKNTRAA